MKYLLILILILFISQSIKYVVRLFSKDKMMDKGVLWTYLWATGAPSTHSAILCSGLVILYDEVGSSAIFVFSCIVAIILMYNLVADRKREEIREELSLKNTEHEREIFISKQVLDISGHTFFDIITGILTGIIFTQLLLILLK